MISRMTLRSYSDLTLFFLSKCEFTCVSRSQLTRGFTSGANAVW